MIEFGVSVVAILPRTKNLSIKLLCVSTNSERQLFNQTWPDAKHRESEHGQSNVYLYCGEMSPSIRKSLSVSNGGGPAFHREVDSKLRI